MKTLASGCPVPGCRGGFFGLKSTLADVRGWSGVWSIKNFLQSVLAQGRRRPGLEIRNVSHASTARTAAASSSHCTPSMIGVPFQRISASVSYRPANRRLAPCLSTVSNYIELDCEPTILKSGREPFAKRILEYVA